MGKRKCDLQWVGVSDWEAPEDGKATLTIRTSDGRELVMCPCPGCLRQLAGYLAGAAVGLEEKAEERARRDEKKARRN